MGRLDHFEKVEVVSRADWRAWLTKNHTQAESIWLVTYKKQTSKQRTSNKQKGDLYLAYDDIVEEALCFGWIDSLPRRLDDERTMLLISPRKPKSVWSKLNKTRVAKLLDAGLMMPSGLAKIAQAKANGMWEFLDDVEALTIPDDLTEALASSEIAQANFAAFSPSTKKGILQWIKMAKQARTRQQRIQKTVNKAAVGQKPL